MSEHVYARVSGYFVTILPRAPFYYCQSAADKRTLILEHTTATTSKQACVTLNDGYSVELGAGTESLDEVADLEASSKGGDWTIETTLFSVAWPHGFDLLSTPNPPGFELLGPNGTLIYPQGPFHPMRLPAVDDMRGPGQQITAQGSLDDTQWIELKYEHEGEAWLQRHYLVTLTPQRTLVITIQSLQEHTKPGIAAAEQLVQTCVPATGKA